MAMFSALWLALGYGSNVQAFRDGIAWWIGGTGIVSIFVGGLVSGVVSARAALIPGVWNSLVMWALLAVPATFVAIAVAAAGVQPADSASGLVNQIPAESLWAAFWSMLIGVGAAVLGGAAGGTARGTVGVNSTGTTDTTASPAYPSPGDDMREDSHRTAAARRR